MEDVDRQKILQTMPGDKRLKRLYEKHLKLERKLASYSGRSYLTSAEEVESKRLKREKLHGVDRMMNLLRENPFNYAA
ncbi:MAG: hypothetical protein J5J00_12710 [Deltaproteobacteria bacterium]|nr:hypothetical protein [Deltaproteobacteria bacterium]